MEQSKKVKSALLFVAISLLTFSANIFGQGYWCNDSNYGMSWWNTNVPSGYELTSDQVAEMNKYRIEFGEKIVPLQKKLRSLQIEMRGNNSYNDNDVAKIKDTRNQIRDIQDEIADFRIEARKNMGSLLSEKQQIYFNNSGGTWWNGLYSRCGWDYEDMTFNSGYGYRNNNMGHGCW